MGPLDALPGGLVDEEVAVARHRIRLLRPRDSEALLDEHAFEQEEYLPYWAELWPSALALAEALAAGPPPAGTAVHEIGCGLGLPAVVAALAGARVLATDWSPAAVQVAAANAERNGARVDVRRWSWTSPPEPLGAPWPLVLAADVLYERRNASQLAEVLPRLVAAGGEAWVADPGRAFADGFLEAVAPAFEMGTVAHRGPSTVAIHRLRPRTSPG